MPTWKEFKNDPSLLEIFHIRQELLSLIRQFFNVRSFTEVSTPILQPAVIPESYLKNFTAEFIDFKGIKHKRFLIPSPEISIKKLLAAGLPKCYEITRCFRNGETGDTHNYEFTMLEWYRTRAGYKDILMDSQDLMQFIFKNFLKRHPQKFRGNYLIYQNWEISLGVPWEMLTVSAALFKFCGISFDEITLKENPDNQFPVKLIARVAAKKGYKIAKNNTWEEIFNQIYLNEIVPRLGVKGHPTVLYDYPAPVAALGKLKNKDRRLVERFEIYIGNLELADACSELTDPEEQKIRFTNNELEIKKSGRNEIKADRDFLEAIDSGLPETAGIALGIDRLVMLFADKKSISDTLLTFA